MPQISVKFSNGQPIRFNVSKFDFWISSALAFISSTSQFVQMNFPFKNAASGLVSQLKSTMSATFSHIKIPFIRTQQWLPGEKLMHNQSEYQHREGRRHTIIGRWRPIGLPAHLRVNLPGMQVHNPNVRVLLLQTIEEDHGACFGSFVPGIGGVAFDVHHCCADVLGWSAVRFSRLIFVRDACAEPT